MNFTLFWAVCALLNFALAWGLFIALDRQRNETSWHRHHHLHYKICYKAAIECRDQAMEQIAALKRQTAGRDKTGRFTKRPKESEVHGSE